MSLQVWLPMTKDLRQQGLSSVTVTNNGATFNSSGKLGGCYQFNGSSYIISQSLSEDMKSASFWCNLSSNTTSQVIFADYKSHLAFGIFSTYICCTCMEYNLRTCYNASLIPTDTWVHIAVVKTSSLFKLYINGELQTPNSTTDSWTSNMSDVLSIGSRSNGTTCMNGKLSDFRLYDHALSQMEVKRIGQGLILHYPLNRMGFGQENLIKNSIGIANDRPFNGTDYSSRGAYVSYPTNTNTIICSQTGAFNCYRWYNGNANLLSITTEELLTNEQPWVFSIDIKSSGAEGTFGLWMNIRVDNYDVASPNIIGNAVTHVSLPNDWKRYWVSITPRTEDSARVNLLIGLSGTITKAGTIQFRNLKFEKGTKMTPWCPNSTEAIATQMGLNSNIEYDTSGYCNNGTKIGTLTYISDTPKYAVSTHIDSTSSKIHISNFPTTGFGNSYSFAWWGKRTSNSPMFWGFSDGIRLNGMYAGTLWNTGDSSNNPIYKPGTTTTITAPSVNVWHHYVMTGDGTTCKLYLDGELYGQAKTYKAISGTSIYINGWDSSTTYCSNDMSMSDFRIYATALSADDVKSLYQNSAYIDSSGNVYGTIHEV